MALFVYNTLNRKKEEFLPLNPPVVRMYVCGVTVYDLCHIGHARSLVVFDVIYRYLRYRGFRVKYVRNFTDLDDKIIARALDEGVGFQEISERYIREFYADTDPLGLERPSVEPRATEHIPEMIEMVKVLLEKGHAYVADGDVYYAVESFPGYGKLSGRSTEEMMAGARVEPDPRKRNPLDFALWKASKPGEPWWDSPWGKGRPGWHLECSVMSQKYLGETLDIHGGGQDLIFPHHENEIAQSEAATGKPFALYWIHNGFVQIRGEKMSKSLGNIVTIKEILKRHHPEALRLFLLGRHYRSPVDYTPERLSEAERALERLYGLLLRAEESLKAPGGKRDWHRVRELLDGLMDRFREAMDDDFNTPRALAPLFELAREVNRVGGTMPKDVAEQVLEATEPFREVLGVVREEPKAFFEEKRRKKLERLPITPEEVQRLIQQRAEARKRRDWATADRIRDELASHGIKLQDTPEGTRWEVE